MPLLKPPFEAIISAKLVLITYTFVDNLSLTNIQKVFYFVQLFYDIGLDLLANNLPNSPTAVPGQP